MSVPSMKAASVILFLVVACFLLPDGTRSAYADYYKYTDKTGAVCITNTPDSVPPKYRATMKVIREETLEKKDRGSRIETPRRVAPAPASPGAAEERKQAAPAAPASTFGRLSARFSWFKPVIVVCAILCTFLVVRKLSATLPSALFARLIYLAFFLGVFVFVFKSYADHLSNSYFTVKTKFIALFEKANRREVPDTVPGERPLPVPEKDRSSQ
jgi:hypothetical protein